jgi:hypothetical protein
VAAAFAAVVGAAALAHGAPPNPPPPATPPSASPPSATPPPPAAQGAEPVPHGQKLEREQQARIERALALHDAARELYQAGAYRAAIAKLEEALALDPEGKELVYNLAVVYEKLGELERAEVYYRSYFEMEQDPKARKEVEAVLRRLQGARRALATRAQEPPTALSPSSAAASAPEPCCSRPIRPWVVGAGTIAVGAFLVGNIFAVGALVRASSDGADTPAVAGLVRRDVIIADVALLVAGISGGLALTFYLTTPPHPPPPPAPPAKAPPRPFSRATAPRIALAITGAGAQVRAQF